MSENPPQSRIPLHCRCRNRLQRNLEVDLVVVAKLSLHGCYVNTPNTLAIDSKVSIKIFVESECFAATAKVVYSLPNSGTGLAFEEVSSKSEDFTPVATQSRRTPRAPLKREYRFVLLSRPL